MKDIDLADYLAILVSEINFVDFRDVSFRLEPTKVFA